MRHKKVWVAQQSLVDLQQMGRNTSSYPELLPILQHNVTQDGIRVAEESATLALPSRPLVTLGHGTFTECDASHCLPLARSTRRECTLGFGTGAGARTHTRTRTSLTWLNKRIEQRQWPCMPSSVGNRARDLRGWGRPLGSQQRRAEGDDGMVVRDAHQAETVGVQECKLVVALVACDAGHVAPLVVTVHSHRGEGQDVVHVSLPPRGYHLACQRLSAPRRLAHRGAYCHKCFSSAFFRGILRRRGTILWGILYALVHVFPLAFSNRRYLLRGFHFHF
mmetsp:Transcript_6724/g.21299  ORF Transcript_6724/g.21299 Transcript_6724/m.21299 type:complete len:278 (+) Transcript_6724:228-1061(+)